MKVKSLLTNSELKENTIYNVFSITHFKDGDIYYHISTSDTSDFFISRYESDYFDIVDWSISKFWSYWYNDFHDLCIGPKETYKIDDFWWKYTEGNNEVEKIINMYFKLWKDELFNSTSNEISEE